MTIRTLDESEGLDGARDEFIYTEARLLADEQTRDLATDQAALISRIEAVLAAQRTCWRQELVAQANADHLHVELDHEVGSLSNDLAHLEGGDHQSARYKRYFAVAPSQIEKAGLETEAKQVEPWVARLAAEPEQGLKDHVAALGVLLVSARSATAALQAAKDATAIHRAQSILPLFSDLNTARRLLDAELSKRGATAHRAKDWAANFFRHPSRRAAAPAR